MGGEAGDEKCWSSDGRRAASNRNARAAKPAGAMLQN